MTTQLTAPADNDTSYLILLRLQPGLLLAIEAALVDGKTAAMIEAYLFQKYGPASLMAGVVAGAAHHIEEWHLAGWNDGP